MTRKMKIGDIVQSPNGLIKITRFNKNGLCLADKLYPPFGGFAHNSNIVRTWPIVDRPKNAPSKRKPLYGQGVIGTGIYRSVENGAPTAAYRAWRGMLQRVYSPQDEATRQAYGDVEVCEEWLNFQNYADWYYRELHSDWKSVPFKWVVDKDLLVPMNRQYRPSVCCIIPQPVNSVMTFRRESSRMSHVKLPLGVSFGRENTLPFAAYCSRIDTGLQFLGFFATVRQAQSAYWEAKFAAIRDTAIQYWKYLPEPLAMRLLTFGFDDVRSYYGDDPYIWGTHGQSLAIDKRVFIAPPQLGPVHVWDYNDPSGQIVGYWVYPDGKRVKSS